MTGSAVAFTLGFKFLYLDKSVTYSVSDPWIYGMSNKRNEITALSMAAVVECCGECNLPVQ
jgi:hypothetical protein